MSLFKRFPRSLAMLAVLPCLLMAACSQQALLDKVSSPEDRALSMKLIQSVQAGDAAYLASVMPPELSKQIAPVLPQMQKALPSGPGTTIRQVDGNVSVQAGANGQSSRQVYLAYAVDRTSQHALVRIGITHQAKTTFVSAIYVNPLAVPAEQLTTFSLEGKSSVHYVFLGLLILSSLICVAGSIVSIFSKQVEHRWLWAIICLFSFCKITLNWSTGAINVMPLSIQLLGGGYYKMGLLSPWQVSFGIPWFALYMLWPSAPKPKRKSKPIVLTGPEEPAS